MDEQIASARDYEILGVSPETPRKDIQSAYLALIETWDPQAVNRETNPRLFEQVHERYHQINQAYQRIAEQFSPASGGAPAAAAPAETRLQGETAIAPDKTPTPASEAHPAFAPTRMESHEPDHEPDHEPGHELGHELGHDTDLEPVSPSAAFISLLRWDKPAGRLILMLPALWAAFLAAGSQWPSWQILLMIVLGSIATSAVGCVVNDLWDQDIDPQVERTRDRPLAAGTLSKEAAIAVAVIAGIVAVVIALLLNPLSKLLCVAAAVVILLYPGAKRVFPVPQLVLAIAWGFAVLIGWAAVAGALTWATGLLWLATVLWTLGFDTVYAMADRDDDRRLGVNSSALFFGDRSAQAVGLFFVGTALMLLWVGIELNLGIWYWISMVLVSLGWLSQHRRLEKHRSRPTSLLYATIFNQNVWLGVVLLVGIIFGRGTV